MSDGTITLDTIIKSLATLELLYPKKSIAAYMKMSQWTRDAVLKRINPVQVSACVNKTPEVGMSDVQVIALRFNGIEMRIESTMPDGLVQIYNSADELIEGCWI
jgi:hypothetical protein